MGVNYYENGQLVNACQPDIYSDEDEREERELIEREDDFRRQFAGSRAMIIALLECENQRLAVAILAGVFGIGGFPKTEADIAKTYGCTRANVSHLARKLHEILGFHRPMGTMRQTKTMRKNMIRCKQKHLRH